VRSFKVSFLIGALFLVVLVCFACFVLDAIRVNVVRGSRALEEYEDEDILSNYSWVKGKCALDLLSQ
jgi:hypothetical protein